MSLFRRPIFGGANFEEAGKKAGGNPVPVNKGPLYTNNGYGVLKPGVLFWNNWDDACTDSYAKVKANVGDNVGSIVDRTTNNRIIIFGNPSQQQKATKGITAPISTSGSNQTSTPTTNVVLTTIMVCQGMTVPIMYTGGGQFKTQIDFFNGWYIGSQYPTFIYQYPSGNNPSGFNNAGPIHVYILQQRPETTNQYIDLWIDGVQVVSGIPFQPPPNGQYGSDYFNFTGSLNTPNPIEFFEACGLAFNLTPDDIAVYTAWFGKRNGVPGF